jgi:hypothetical protein
VSLDCLGQLVGVLAEKLQVDGLRGEERRELQHRDRHRRRLLEAFE